MACPPSTQSGEGPPSGISLQTASRSLISAPTPTPGLLAASRAAQPGLGVLGDQLFQDARRCQVLSLNPHSSSPSFQTGWELCWEEPQTPLLSVHQEPRSHGPSCPHGSAGPGPPGAHPAPPPSSSLSTAFQTLPSASRASSCPGAGGALWGGTRPPSLHTPPRAVPYPSGVTPGERGLLLAPPWGMEDGVGSPGPPETPCISV